MCEPCAAVCEGLRHSPRPTPPMGRGVIAAAVRLIALVGLCAVIATAAPTPPAAAAPVAATPTPGTTTTGARRLPATGQLVSSVIGDDGSVRAGAPLSYVDNGDGTISDRTTGLMWEKKAKLDNVPDAANPHDADNCYPWRGNCEQGGAVCATNADCGANGACAATDCQTKAPNGLTVFKWVMQLNAAKFAGHSDWRVPNAKELESLIDYNAVNPSVAPAFNSPTCSSCDTLTDATCSCTRSNNYWSSTPLPNSINAWVVYFASGSVVYNAQTSLSYVRAVRGGK